jgi:GT2 family glycosyltransferase
MKKKTIYVGIPTFKDLPFEFVLSLVDMISHSSKKYRILTGFCNRTFRNIARETLIETALASKADYLLFLDDDMVFPNDTIDRLVKHDVGVVSALAFGRKEPYSPCALNMCYRADDDIIAEEYLHINNWPKDALLRVDATGLACTLIKKEVLEAIGKYSCTSKEGAGEDVEFMRQCRFKGYSPYVDTGLSIGHLGDRIVITEGAYNANAKR